MLTTKEVTTRGYVASFDCRQKMETKEIGIMRFVQKWGGGHISTVAIIAG